MGGPGLDDLTIYALTHWPYLPLSPPTKGEPMSKESKLSAEDTLKIEEEMVKLASGLDDKKRATLYILLNAEGMSLTKAHAIRVKAGMIS